MRQRNGHSATLLPDGNVRLDGGDLPQQQSTSTEIYNPDLQAPSIVDGIEPENTFARLAFVSPFNGSEVAADARVVVQFTKPAFNDTRNNYAESLSMSYRPVK